MALIGYARVSTIEQNLEAQMIELRAVGCEIIHQETASGAKDARRVLRHLLVRMKKGDTLVVVRIDRLARSLPHLLLTIEEIRKKGCHFRSLRDPIDTSSPTGMFQLQIMGAVAELERNIIRERTIAGLLVAKAAGRKSGNPGIMANRPEAIKKLSDAKKASYLASLVETADSWLPIVRKFRPHLPWGDVMRRLNAALPAGMPRWSEERLIRAVKRLVAEGMAEPELLHLPVNLTRFTPGQTENLTIMIAGMKQHEPEITLREIARRLESMKQRTPRGGHEWKPGSVAHLLERARKFGLLKEETETVL
jgi:DNA invertase Pin-like site-specific DNA recombinase